MFVERGNLKIYVVNSKIICFKILYRYTCSTIIVQIKILVVENHGDIFGKYDNLDCSKSHT